MPPKKGIVKSGNAGNSSKPSPLPKPADEDSEEKKPLFPIGSKYPLSLLYENCQKRGWEKPTVDTRRQGNGCSFVVTLWRVNSDTKKTESVRLEPHPPYVMPSAIEARHWGATYALYRFCNGLQLNRVLPPGPREYWQTLAAEHKAVPDHQQWEYDSDPFAARKAVDERQAKATKARDEQLALEAGPDRRQKKVRTEFDNAPEVRMAGSLRETVEEAIKKAMSSDPSAEGALPAVISEMDAPSLFQQLAQLGFKQHQARNALEFLSQPFPLTQNLLRTSSPLEACIEYLILHIPECDLPSRMLPDQNSSNPFVTSTHSGTSNLKTRWIEDRATKEAGFPSRPVRQCIAEKQFAESWDLTIAALNRMLIGDDWKDTIAGQNAEDVPEDAVIREEDLEGIWAYYTDTGQLVLPINTADIKVNFILPQGNRGIVASQPPPMYITSPSVPAYVRLHLLSVILRAIAKQEIAEPGIGFIVECMGILEAEWALIEENGPPDISTVLKHLLPPPEEDVDPVGEDSDKSLLSGQRKGRKHGRRRQDERDGAQVRRDFEAVCKDSKYITLRNTRERLPSFAAKDDFLKMLDKNRVVIVVGETGCGKTTQLPQFILDSLIMENRGKTASIIVTQPRRVAATSVAARVSAERVDDGSVGYAIRGESKQSHRTKLLFCTTGVVLRRMGLGDALGDVTHVIVDEVHERTVDGDFLLLELKELLATHKTLKVILMSATINHETFVKYFNNAPLLTIPGFTHPVTDVYLEDIVPEIKYRPQFLRSSKKEKDDEQRATREDLVSKGLDDESARAVQAISRADRIDYQLVAAVVRHIVDTAPKRGGVLIFLPGVQEIRQCMDALKSSVGGKADIFPLHANLSSDEQRRVFASTQRWKVIAATNVAETSITIDDVIYVIDGGKVKETQYDPVGGLSRLAEIWTTRAAGRQRRGRAGRTQPGTCYKLYTRAQEAKFAAFPVPEIMRVPLESIALTVKVAKEGEDVKAFLGRAVDPPAMEAMDKALSVLEELGAIDVNGSLTALGRHISMLPVDLRLAKMLILGTIFQCLDPILTVAAGLSCKPLFVSPLDNREEASQARARFARGNSDLLTDAFAYEKCMALRADGKSQSGLKIYCEQNFISASTVRDISSLRHDFLGALADTGFVPFGLAPTDRALNAHGAHENLLKGVIAGALWPRVARVTLPAGAVKFDKVSAGTVQRANAAKEFRFGELDGARVFLHPGSVLFGAAAWKADFVAYFARHKTTKVFLRDATEVPTYALLLFGGPVTVDHVKGGLTVKTSDGVLKLKAWPRIGVLVNQLRRLLDVQLQRSIEDGSTLGAGQNNPVLKAMLALLENDGLSG